MSGRCVRTTGFQNALASSLQGSKFEQALLTHPILPFDFNRDAWPSRGHLKSLVALSATVKLLV